MVIQPVPLFWKPSVKLNAKTCVVPFEVDSVVVALWGSVAPISTVAPGRHDIVTPMSALVVITVFEGKRDYFDSCAVR
jgi:hypothetical protein